jgi:hypothetical protein
MPWFPTLPRSRAEPSLAHSDNGSIMVKQEIDGWHPVHGAILEVESGRAWQGNAVYRDLVRASLVEGADYLVMGVRQEYVYGARSTAVNDFTRTRDMLEAVYASGRLVLPFKGVIVFGW